MSDLVERPRAAGCHYGLPIERDTAEAADRIAELEAKVAELERERDDLRRKLFPFADATEISGMSWNGFNLLGDEKSIKELRRLENRSSQLEVYTAAYEERIATAKAEAEKMRAALIQSLEIRNEAGDYIDRARAAIRALGEVKP